MADYIRLLTLLFAGVVMWGFRCGCVRVKSVFWSDCCEFTISVLPAVRHFSLLGIICKTQPTAES